MCYSIDSCHGSDFRRQLKIVILRMKIENYNADCITNLEHMVSLAAEKGVDEKKYEKNEKSGG